MKKDKSKKLTEGNIISGFILFAIPLFFGSLFQQLYSTVDLIFVGRILGKHAAAAIGASGIIVTCLIGLFTGISVGAGIIIAQLFGAKKEHELKENIVNALFIGGVGGLLILGAGLIFGKQALIWIHTPESLVEDALIYLRIYFISALPMILYNMGASILRATGDSKTPFRILAIGGILNVLMDTLFIMVLDLEIRGPHWQLCAHKPLPQLQCW